MQHLLWPSSQAVPQLHLGLDRRRLRNNGHLCCLVSSRPTGLYPCLKPPPRGLPSPYRTNREGALGGRAQGAV